MSRNIEVRVNRQIRRWELARRSSVSEPPLPCVALSRPFGAGAAELGITVGREYTGGSADSGFTAAVGAPTLCGTGPLGAKAHSPDEVCHLDTLIPRAKAVALAILRLER